MDMQSAMLNTYLTLLPVTELELQEIVFYRRISVDNEALVEPVPDRLEVNIRYTEVQCRPTRLQKQLLFKLMS